VTSAPATTTATASTSTSATFPFTPAVVVGGVADQTALLQSLIKERDLLRINVKRLHDENRELRERFAAERDELQQRIVALEYDRSTTTSSSSLSTSLSTASNNASSVTQASYDALAMQHNALLEKLVAYQSKLADWEAWKTKAELIAQDLAKRLKEEQKIRRKLDALLAVEQPQQHQQFHHQQQQLDHHAPSQQQQQQPEQQQSRGIFGFFSSSSSNSGDTTPQPTHSSTMNNAHNRSATTNSSSSSSSNNNTSLHHDSRQQHDATLSPSKEFSISVHHI
jgi:hypothetical protein